MRTIPSNILSLLCVLLLLGFAIRAWSCPDDLAEKLHNHLKTKIDWVDVNANSDNLKLTIRYYPCFSSRSSIDLLISEAINTIPNCSILNHGEHQLVENYCVLKDIEFRVGDTNL